MLPGFAGSQMMAAAGASKSYLGNLTDAGQLSALRPGARRWRRGELGQRSAISQWSDLSGQGNHYVGLEGGAPIFHGRGRRPLGQ